jgi:hypothetical protein
MMRNATAGSGFFICVRDVEGAQQSGLPDRAEAEPGAARPAGQRPAAGKLPILVEVLPLRRRVVRPFR